MRWIAITFMLLLGGCDIANSDRPMFPEVDTVDAPRFENGVWALSEQDDCSVDKTRPVSKWPECADWAFHQDGRWFVRAGNMGVEVRPVADSVVVVGGEVAIVQIELLPDDPDEGVTFWFWAFDYLAANEPLREFALWQVLCGLRETQSVKATTDTESPDEEAVKEVLVRFQGFNEKCQPDSVASLRAAALASRPSSVDDRDRFQWVRTQLD